MSECCTIIVDVFYSRYSVRCSTGSSITEDSAEKLYNNGNEYSPWSDTEWDTIIRNIGIDRSRNACRFIVFSDRPIECPKDFQGIDWTKNDISAARNVCGIDAGRWNLNGTELTASNWQKFLPEKRGEKTVFVTTFPEFAVASKQQGSEEESELYRYIVEKSKGL